MSEIPPLSGVAPGTVRPAGPSSTVLPAETRPASPAFEVLLERLEKRAAELEERSKTLSRPEELSGVLDAARASLEEAVHLGEGLLEAYRAARRTGEAGA
jgi:hypothetical protein